MMLTIDLMRIIENVSQTLAPVRRMVSGGAYIMGITMLILGIAKLKKIAESQANSNSSEPLFVPLVYFAVGAGLCYLPSFLTVMGNTVFGINSILQYTSTDPFDYQTAVVTLIQTVGLIWFVRGSVMMANASAPGKQHGFKGMVYLFAGIFAVNYYSTVDALNYSFNVFVTAASKLKQATGY